jgi:hypothetical protein
VRKYRIALRARLGFRLIHRIDGEDRMRIGTAGSHLRGNPNRFHDLLFGRAVRVGFVDFSSVLDGRPAAN